MRSRVSVWSPKELEDTSAAPTGSRLEFLATHGTDMTMAMGTTIDRPNVTRYVSDREFALFVDMHCDALLCQGADEGFRDGVAAAVAAAAYVRLQIVGVAEAPQSNAAILRPLIRKNQGAVSSSTPYRVHGLIEHKLAMRHRAGAPGDDHAGEKIHNHREV